MKIPWNDKEKTPLRIKIWPELDKGDIFNAILEKREVIPLKIKPHIKYFEGLWCLWLRRDLCFSLPSMRRKTVKALWHDYEILKISHT